METQKRKKSTTELTNEYRGYWESYFIEKGIERPIFSAKLCYNDDKPSKDGNKIPALRFYADELSKGQDLYVELYNTRDTNYHEGERVLYKLKSNLNWRSTGKFFEVTHTSKGEIMATPAYVCSIEVLELISRNSIKTNEPELKIQDSTFLPRYEDVNIEEVSTEKDDAHYAQLTIRDIYCIVNNKPLSNKKWLNNLINQGK